MSPELAACYDALYHGKLYELEALAVRNLAWEAVGTGRARLLEVACGTGRRLEFLRRDFEVEGLDICPAMLTAAQARNPGVPLHCADMMRFQLRRRFDVMVCLASAIGYAGDAAGLDAVAGRMAGHLEPGGLLLVEPWFTPQSFSEERMYSILVEQPGLRIAGVATARRQDRCSQLEAHYLIARPGVVRHVVEHERMGLFEQEEITQALERHGLHARFDGEVLGFSEKGLYIAGKGRA